MTGPLWFKYAMTLLGIREVPGPKHNPTILLWLKQLGAWWRDDETPWCGVFVAHVMKHSGLAIPKNWFRAKEWATWGIPVVPQVGAVGVKSRKGGGHVFLISGITKDGAFYKAVGGNQGNATSETDIAVDEVEHVRWPANEPVLNIPLPVKRRGTVVSEA